MAESGKSLDSFQAKIDAKRQELSERSGLIKYELNSNFYNKKESLADASVSLHSRYLNDTTLKDFPTIFNAGESTPDGDTIEVTSPWNYF